jgi:hypothetical protein
MNIEDISGAGSGLGLDSLSAKGPKGVRYVINPNNPAEVIDMRHFLVVGKRGELFGLGVEIFQFTRGYRESAFNSQDFLSNYLGERFYSKLDRNAPWRTQLLEFFNNQKRKNHENICSK